MGTWSKVVVGVDGSEGSRRALAWAAAEARDHGAGLTVLASWSPPVAIAGPGYSAYPEYGAADLSGAATSELAAALEAVLGKEPGLPLERIVVEGHAAHRLVEASDGADLLVVGCRGHGGFAGMLLGSVSQHVAAHARCPVVVVR